MEQPFWEDYERQRQEARVRAEQEYLRQEREQERRRNQRQEQRKQRRQQNHTEHQATHQAVKKPVTLAEALKILKLKPPVTRAEIKHAFRVQAQKAHPDHGGSHTAMVTLNAAYELALASA